VIITCHAECCTPDETSLPAVRWMPQRRVSGIVLLPCCHNHVQSWWEGADWDGHELEVAIPWEYSVDFERLNDFVVSHGFGEMNSEGRKLGYELITRDGDYAAAGAEICTHEHLLRPVTHEDPAPVAALSYMSLLLDYGFGDYHFENDGLSLVTANGENCRLEIAGLPGTGPYGYDTEEDIRTVQEAVRTAIRHLSSGRSARVLLGTRTSEGWIEHHVQVMKPNGSHLLTIGVLQRKEGADIERCS